MPIETLVPIIGQLGFPIALVIYFLYRDIKRDKEDKDRETSINARAEKMEERIYLLTEKSIEVQAANTQILKELSDTLKSKPCLLANTHTQE